MVEMHINTDGIYNSAGSFFLRLFMDTIFRGRKKAQQCTGILWRCNVKKLFGFFFVIAVTASFVTGCSVPATTPTEEPFLVPTSTALPDGFTIPEIVTDEGTIRFETIQSCPPTEGWQKLVMFGTRGVKVELASFVDPNNAQAYGIQFLKNGNWNMMAIQASQAIVIEEDGETFVICFSPADYALYEAPPE